MFSVRIDIQGLFWIHPDQLPSPNRVLFIAPWVVPEKPEECPHDLVVQWKPRQLGQSVPGQAETVWRLEGKRLSFDFQGRASRRLDAQPETWRIPWIHDWQTQAGERIRGIFTPEEAPGAKIRDDVLKDPGQFQAAEVARNGRPTNRESVLGQVLIDRGELLNDEIEAIPASIEPGGYRGRFTNRLSLIVQRVDSFHLVVEDLLPGDDGAPKPPFRLPLEPKDRPQLQLRVRHICPQFLLHDEPPFFGNASMPYQDEDFRHLYELCQAPGELPRRPIPERHGNPHSKPRWDCGSLGG